MAAQLERTLRRLGAERLRFERTLQSLRNPFKGNAAANGAPTLCLLCKRVIGLKWRHPTIVRRFIDFALECHFDRQLLLAAIDDCNDADGEPVAAWLGVGANRAKSVAMIDRQLEAYAVRAMCGAESVSLDLLFYVFFLVCYIYRVWCLKIFVAVNVRSMYI